MRYLKVDIQSLRVKGDTEDPDTLQEDIYEKLQAMIESETLTFTVDEDFEEDED